MQGVGVGGVGVGAGANLNAETDTRDLNTFELAAELDSSGDSKGESQQQNLRTYVRKLALIQSFASSIPPWRRAAVARLQGCKWPPGKQASPNPCSIWPSAKGQGTGSDAILRTSLEKKEDICQRTGHRIRRDSMVVPRPTVRIKSLRPTDPGQKDLRRRPVDHCKNELGRLSCYCHGDCHGRFCMAS